MTVMTLGRKAFEAFWLDRASKGERGAKTIADSGWGNTSLVIRNAWEQAALCIQATLKGHGWRDPDDTYQAWLEARAVRTHKGVDGTTVKVAQECPRPFRQGGMVNVHTKPPAHYNAHPSGVECIEVTRHLPFNLGNVVKYIWRAGLKENESEIKDLEKSLDYLNDEINKRKLALGIKPETFTRFGQGQAARWEAQPDARIKDHTDALVELEHRALVARTTPVYGPDGKGHQ